MKEKNWRQKNPQSSSTNKITLLRACSYGQKLSRLARKHFDKFTSEISPCYENNMKSYIAFISDEKFSRVPRSRLLTGEISVTGMFFPYEHNFPA